MNDNNVNEILFGKFGFCGCTEDKLVIQDIIKLLKWGLDKNYTTKINYGKLFSEVGYFYVLAGLLNNIDCFEHGVSLRVGWTTEKGKKFLSDLENIVKVANKT